VGKTKEKGDAGYETSVRFMARVVCEKYLLNGAESFLGS